MAWRYVSIRMEVCTCKRVNVYQLIPRIPCTLDRSQQPSPQLANACFPLSHLIYLPNQRTAIKTDPARMKEGMHQNNHKQKPAELHTTETKQSAAAGERESESDRENDSAVCVIAREREGPTETT